MKTVVVYGQKHRGNTWRLTQMLLEKLDCRKEETEEYFINGIGQCIGCYTCIMEDEMKCPHRKETDALIRSIETAELIIFSSPNYCFEMTGQMKSFCDHMAYRWMIHRPVDMRRKIGVAISTTAGGGAGSVTKSIVRQFSWWSVGRTYQFPVAVWADNWEKISEKRMRGITRKVNKLAGKINCKIAKSRACIKTRLLFAVMRKMHQGEGWNKVEHEYWKANGFFKR